MCALNAPAMGSCLKSIIELSAESHRINQPYIGHLHRVHYARGKNRQRSDFIKAAEFNRNPFLHYPSADTNEGPSLNENQLKAAFQVQYQTVATLLKNYTRPWQFSGNEIQRLYFDMGERVIQYLKEKAPREDDLLSTYVNRMISDIQSADIIYKSPQYSSILSYQISFYLFESAADPKLMWQMAQAEIWASLAHADSRFNGFIQAHRLEARSPGAYVAHMLSLDTGSTRVDRIYEEANPFCENKKDGFQPLKFVAPFYRSIAVEKFHYLYDDLKTKVSGKIVHLKDGLEKEVLLFLVNHAPLENETFGEYISRAHSVVLKNHNFIHEDAVQLIIKEHFIVNAPSPYFMWQLLVAENLEPTYQANSVQVKALPAFLSDSHQAQEQNADAALLRMRSNPIDVFSSAAPVIAVDHVKVDDEEIGEGINPIAAAASMGVGLGSETFDPYLIINDRHPFFNTDFHFQNIVYPAAASLSVYLLFLIGATLKEASLENEDKENALEARRKLQEIKLKKLEFDFKKLQTEVVAAVMSIAQNKNDVDLKLNKVNTLIETLKQEVSGIDSKYGQAIKDFQTQIENTVLMLQAAQKEQVDALTRKIEDQILRANEKTETKIHELETESNTRAQELRNELIAVQGKSSEDLRGLSMRIEELSQGLSASQGKSTEELGRLSQRIELLSQGLTSVNNLVQASPLRRIALNWIKELRKPNPKILLEFMIESFQNHLKKSYPGETFIENNEMLQLIEEQSKGVAWDTSLLDSKIQLLENNLKVCGKREQLLYRTQPTNPLKFFKDSTTDNVGEALAFVMAKLSANTFSPDMNNSSATQEFGDFVSIFKDGRFLSGVMVSEPAVQPENLRFKLIAIDHKANDESELRLGYADELLANEAGPRIMDAYEWALIQTFNGIDGLEPLDDNWKELLKKYAENSYLKTKEKYILNKALLR